GIQSVSPLRRGVASNTNYFGIDLGFFIGPTIAGAVYAKTNSYSTMFLLFIIPVFLALVVFTAGLKPFYKRVEAKRVAEAEETGTG
ncbi:MAG: hypothetical protein QM368_00560, partial [Bacillota bacterium]|nr:hypothetical protein [Bacillota bacterium]